MKRLLLAATAALTLSGAGFSQMMGGMHGGMSGGHGSAMQQAPMQPYYYQPMPMMMPMMMMPMMMGMHGGMGMGGMNMGGMGMGGMMQDPQTQKIIREHMQKCRKELMKKLAKRPSQAERMLHMMVMHPEAFKEALKRNPELKKKLRELLK